MKFEEMPLRVPNEKKIENFVKKLVEDFKGAEDAKTAIKIVKKYFKFCDDLDTDVTIISIRNSINTEDKVYEEAMDKVDEIMPIAQGYFDELNKLIYNSKFRKELEDEFGSLYFKQLDIEFKSFSEEIIPELQKENKLTTRYAKLYASAKLEFKGEVLNMTQIGKYLSDKDPNVRLEAAKLYYGFLEKNDAEFGQIYDDLVKTRTLMAEKLGYKNFVELGYYRLGRLDYNADMVKGYREQIKKDVVPVVAKLRKRQAKRLGIKNPNFLDFNLEYLTGNPKPMGDSKYLVNSAKKMYEEMSEETGKFFNFMIDNNLMDLDAKAGKKGGGYMTFIARYKSPFIFANSNGTSADVDTLTHEVGHAFQGYLSANKKVPAYRSPTLEACEIHSMSMEFFAWPWMNLFFENPDKYRFSHLDGAISFLPYGAEVDEFQHFVYENPNISHEERCRKWSELDKIYRPWLKFKGFKYLENGGMWIRQSHIYEVPFYYIDYTLAQVVALEFKCEMDKNREKAWKKYVKLCKMGGESSFLELLKRDHLRNPFEDGNVKKVIKPQMKVLDSFDDANY